ncbi:hypothetical protein AWZ03_013705 [Drosophila navojoa]|uniref:Uncharacterized protein n=1 Tax=Drosophila navojoa TaxID=7232 RepID=A0A484AU35_DRONA|nr:hypothetical protein AWZ03_013705 [Drosophila navojoa]
MGSAGPLALYVTAGHGTVRHGSAEPETVRQIRVSLGAQPLVGAWTRRRPQQLLACSGIPGLVSRSSAEQTPRLDTPQTQRAQQAPSKQQPAVAQHQDNTSCFIGQPLGLS